MNKETQNIIQDQFKTLPKVIQDTILNSKWQEKIRRVVKDNKLHIDQGAAIENLVLITMLGIETPENFVSLAKQYAQVTNEQAHNISAQVEKEIFGDIRRKLIETTDGVGTVAEIDKTTNELGKVAADIEAAAKLSSKQSPKPSLKEKIPENYFEKNDSPKISEEPVAPQTNPTTPPTPKPDAYREPIPEPVVIKSEAETPVPAPTPPKPIFTPMPKTIDQLPQTETVNTSSVSNNVQTAKVDPYREPIE